MVAGTTEYGEGCRFCGRCPIGDSHCRTAPPPLEEIAPGHTAACYKLDSAGLCEKAWAQPVWLVVEEVPKDYSASFNLSYTVN